ncbi:MAG: AraC family transcriptional regulator [Lachnospiraceae bacterium]|jgi:AraC-like DNA-binding protein|nr:AraC family transcriptional regulator [Lachnospiraceae bacterium]MCH4031902.1 AraC family transcriptional regulator [Lachnospiraceae bacterium]MCH4070526.1 AraC family transcriptional regulator [Lachnospiraceae bacterium]MCH4109193.1 AraC family transcriptional regulator [Lachnospiraceae bacterium]MCI1332531.1 AraC family transcriptional regulator [Lachnospiraceae bacterium]
MRQDLLEQLAVLTPEEEKLKAGAEIEKGIYMPAGGDVVDVRRLAKEGRLITIRKNVRFAFFPKHRHNYVEVLYMCEGSTRHILNGEEITVRSGDLLMLSQRVTQEVYPAGEHDIGVNFLILPEFFNGILRMIPDEKNAIRDFLIGTLAAAPPGAGTDAPPFLLFHAADFLPVQNLMENLIYGLLNRQGASRTIEQNTFGLLLLYLMKLSDHLQVGAGGTDELMMKVLDYVDSRYRDASLTDLAQDLHYDPFQLSRMIKRRMGRNFTDLVQERRLSQARYLLTHTQMSVLSVAGAVGYSNVSYFHRIFRAASGQTPRHYRLTQTHGSGTET